MLDHIVQVKTTTDKIKDSAGQGPGTNEVTTEISSLFAASNMLRDYIDDTLARLLRDQQRLDQIGETLQHAPGSTAYTWLGIETLFRDWWSRDEERVRLVSCVLLDLDRFAQVNAQQGAETGDQIMMAFEVLLQSLLRTDRGFDRVARASSDRFLLFLGDTASGNAVSGAERVRQTIEATSFQVGDNNIELTACCGVIEVGKTEQTADFFLRLTDCVVAAKKAGRNQSFIDEGSGPQMVELPQYKVQGRVIEIGDSSTPATE